MRPFDYADLDIPMFRRMFDRRCVGYEAVGYSILLPASAVAGWPPEVPLPASADWKQSYSSSVQRLIRDGVDTSLATLFLQASPPRPVSNPTALPARSASEAFLHRRLETLPVTHGRFRLNASLPIPFDGFGHMEVDFLDPTTRLVIELDGDQHLADVEAYRRDRRKDALLQEHGYTLLRFLAQDLGRRLSDVLDSIHRAVAHRANQREP